jgi:hypothetical protein
MYWWKRPTSLLGTLAGLALLLGPQAGQAQQEPRKVTIKTADGVELAGTFYQGNKNDATVMFLHSLAKGENSHKAGWDNLAKALNKKGYSVLTFDFRGYGDSTSIASPQKFWAYNRSGLVKPNKADPGTISAENFDYRYYPILINDIAAAKSFLDLQNDGGNCNSSALVIIGADTGATLGAIWLNSECHRFKVTPAAFPARRFPTMAEDSEGTAVAAAIFLSISPTLGKSSVNLSSTLRIPGQVNAVPMVFVYGPEDKKGKAEAKKLHNFMKLSRVKQQPLTGVYPVPGAGKATGRDLLRTGLPTEQQIVDYVGRVLTKSQSWIARDFQKSPYIWAFSPPRVGGLLPAGYIEAKAQEDLVIRWNDYARFIGR